MIDTNGGYSIQELRPSDLLLTMDTSFLSGTDTASEMELMPKPDLSTRINHTNSCNGTRDPEETSDTTETDVLTLEVVNNHQ